MTEPFKKIHNNKTSRPIIWPACFYFSLRNRSSYAFSFGLSEGDGVSFFGASGAGAGGAVDSGWTVSLDGAGWEQGALEAQDLGAGWQYLTGLQQLLSPPRRNKSNRPASAVSTQRTNILSRTRERVTYFIVVSPKLVVFNDDCATNRPRL